MNEENWPAQARRITLALFSTQSLVSCGIIASATLNSILGAHLGGSNSWAGVPSAIYMVGGALAAFGWGYLMDAIGRRGGLALGLGIGALGAALAFRAVNLDLLSLFLSAAALMGIANAAMLLGRFAAGEVHPPAERGRAISNVVLGGTIGAIFGPLLVAPAGALALQRGFDELSGAYAATFLAFLLGVLVIFAGLRPDPRDLGREISKRYPTHAGSGERRPMGEILRQPEVAIAMLSMILSMVVMVSVMVITSLHMRQHQHGLGQVSWVISAHTIGMYAFSAVSGRLVDRWGRGKVIISGAAGMTLACLWAAFSTGVLPLSLALFLLGLGWNFCFVGGSTLLSDQLSPAERSRTQGVNDLLMGLAAAMGSLGSGLVFARFGYTVMALFGAGLALVLLATVMGWMRSRRLALGVSTSILLLSLIIRVWRP